MSLATDTATRTFQITGTIKPCKAEQYSVIKIYATFRYQMTFIYINEHNDWLVDEDHSDRTVVDDNKIKAE